MAAGRFRVKTGIDHATAERLVMDLESLGASCVIAEESSQALAPPAAAQKPASSPAPSPAPLPSPAPAPSPAPLPSPAPAAKDSLPAGLAAALSNNVQQDLGVLGSGSGSFTLATLDGEEEEPERKEQTSFAPPSSAAAFAPPDSGEEQVLQLAVNIKKPPPRPRATQDQDMATGGTPAGAAPAHRMSAPAIAVPAAAPGAPSPARAPARISAAQPAVSSGGAKAAVQRLLDRVRSDLIGSERVRFAVGVMAALLIGFLPAHIFASVREGSAFSEVDADVTAQQAQVSDVEGWHALDAFRTAQLERKESKQASIALTSMFIWALISGGLAFVWFRKIDWERYRGG